MRLYTKLLLAFVAVVLLGVAIVAVLANQAARREVTSLIVDAGTTSESQLALELAGYYRGHGSWDSVPVVFRGGPRPGPGRGQRLIVADVHGTVVADSGGSLTGQSLTAAQLATGVPIEVDGVRVGTVLAVDGGPGGPRPGPPGVPATPADVLLRVNSAIWLAALVGSGAALLVGGVLAYGLVQPIRTLTAATGAVAAGNLSQRVPVNSTDELGELGQAFNTMAASLERAEQQRRDMTADIAHELRNPIAVLQANLEGVIDGVLPPTPENLTPLLDQTHMLARLVDDLRTVALADAGQLGLERENTNPVTLGRSAVAQFQSQANAQGVSLSLEAPDGLPAVMVDPQRITQVLGNLLSNALRHAPAGSTIALRLSVEPEPTSRVRFSVRDSGPGIPPEVLPHIFERFYRADEGRSRLDGGTGLGLTIAKQLVEAHGGSIWARSEPGQGAEVGFTLSAGAG